MQFGLKVRAERRKVGFAVEHWFVAVVARRLPRLDDLASLHVVLRRQRQNGVQICLARANRVFVLAATFPVPLSMFLWSMRT